VNQNQLPLDYRTHEHYEKYTKVRAHNPSYSTLWRIYTYVF